MDYAVSLFLSLDTVTQSFIVQMGLALFLGYIMGAEREFRGKDAGISTNMFVIVGSMLFTFLSVNVDPASTSRIAAQIVSGIGFLGAGLILKDGASVRNLTTAASIWYAGSIGMAIGFGYYTIAVITGLVGVLIPRIRHVQTQVEAVEHVVHPLSKVPESVIKFSSRASKNELVLKVPKKQATAKKVAPKRVSKKPTSHNENKA